MYRTSPYDKCSLTFGFPDPAEQQRKPQIVTKQPAFFAGTFHSRTQYTSLAPGREMSTTSLERQGGAERDRHGNVVGDVHQRGSTGPCCGPVETAACQREDATEENASNDHLDGVHGSTDQVIGGDLGWAETLG